MLFFTLVQDSLHEEQALEHQHKKEALAMLYCLLPTVTGLAVDQLLPWCY